jgi:hypothetical protein
MTKKTSRQTSFSDDASSSKELVQIKGSGLGKEQIRFNKLIQEIRSLIEEINVLQETLPKAHAEFSAIMMPIQKEFAAFEIEIIKAADLFYRESKLGKRQKETVEGYILFKIKDFLVEPPEDIKEIFNRYSDLSYEEDRESQKEFINTQFSTVFKEMFDVEVDLDLEPNLSEAENKARFHQKMKDLGIDPSSGFSNFDDFGPGGKKGRTKEGRTKKEEANQQKRLKEEELRKKSFKTIYTDLMKAFHPDTETDPDLKLEKEEISKKITLAYGSQDYFTLLRLEAEYLAGNEERIQTLPKNQLGIYLKMLSEQKAILKQQKDGLLQTYPLVYNWIFGRRQPLKAMLTQQKREFEMVKQELKNYLRMLNSREPAIRKTIVEFMEDDMMAFMDSGF